MEIAICLVIQIFLLICIKPITSMIVRKPNRLYQVTCKCNPSPNNVTQVVVRADLPATIKVHCKNDYVVKMTTSDDVQYVTDVGFTEQDGSNCIFKKKRNSKTYTLTFDLAWNSINDQSSLLLVRDQFVVVCTYDNFGSTKTHKTSIDTSNRPPNSIYYGYGQHMTSHVDIKLEDTHGKIVDGIIPIGTIIRLVLTVTGTELMKAQQCWATNQFKKYPILIAGCGDGVVFEKNKGFRTVQKKIYSPYFSAFRLLGANDVFFECIVNGCKPGVNCDGTSCILKKRRKRNAIETGFNPAFDDAENIFQEKKLKRGSTKSHFVNTKRGVLRYFRNGLTIL